MIFMMIPLPLPRLILGELINEPGYALVDILIKVFRIDRVGRNPAPDFLLRRAVDENNDYIPFRHRIHVYASSPHPEAEAVILNIQPLPRDHKVGDQEIGLPAIGKASCLQLSIEGRLDAAIIQRAYR